MKLQYFSNLRALFAIGLTLIATTGSFAQDDPVGFVRITQPKASETSPQQVTPASFHHHLRQQAPCDCQNGVTISSDSTGNEWCDECQNGRCRFGHHGHCQNGDGVPYWYWRADHGEAMTDYVRCKLGYFIPTGAGGAGVPWVGKYSRVYPQNPHYFDQRDGQAWAAQGYGVPMAVPLAPVVGHTYNYGWGIPSSRLTPVSHPAY